MTARNLVLLVVVASLIGAAITTFNSPDNISTFPVYATEPLNTPFPTRADRPNLLTNLLDIDPANLHVGDHHGGIMLREIKTVSGNELDFDSNIAVTFQGPIKLTAKMTSGNKCADINPDSQPRLPRWLDRGLITQLCFDNPEQTIKILSKIPNPITITIDNFTLPRCKCNQLPTASLLSAN